MKIELTARDYITGLRRLVGHRPLIMVGAAALIVDDEGRLLLLKRADNDCWGPPGGAMEPGESLEETARRETREETGLELDEMTLVGVFSGPKLYYRYPSGDEVYNVTVVYRSTASGELEIDPTEHLQAGYFPIDKLPSPLSPPIVPIIQCLAPNTPRAGLCTS